MNQFSKGKRQGVSIIFLNPAKEILLALRDDKPGLPYSNCWDILGGHVEEGETPEACVKREIAEEIEVAIDYPKLFRVYDMPDRIEHTFWQNADFDLTRIRLNEGQALRWFNEGQVRELADERFAYGFKSVLLDFYREKPFLNLP